ncbi:MAG: hypothetical protein ABW133_22185 [Polyangiaceae bacterium]
MDTRIDPGGSRMDVIATNTAPRVTPSSGVPFRDMVARGAGAILRGAEAAISSLPGAPIVAAAVRPVTGSPSIPSGTGGIVGTGGMVGTGAPSVGVPRSPIAGGSAENPVGGGVAGGTGTENGSVEGTLAQSQEFNLYYLQLQEQLSAENRAFSAMSNVLKTRHDTVKNAIGNIR